MDGTYGAARPVKMRDETQTDGVRGGRDVTKKKAVGVGVRPLTDLTSRVLV